MTSMTSNALPDNAIAVIGMAGRFPGADSVSQFWHNLRRGEESIVSLSEEELITEGIGEKALGSPSYVRRAALLSGIEEFDAEFFGFTPQAARMMDPQQRLFLQCAWHALEDAGLDPRNTEGAVGTFGTSSASGYLLHNLMSNYDPMAIIGQGATFEMISLSLQNDKDHLATRVAHQLDLRGPALSVQTACSSALVAVHLACQSLLAGECDMALAGGVSIRVPHRVGYWYEPGSMVSASGHCRPFDMRSDGTIFGSGVGIVVLKPLQHAVQDGDRIHAVIRGSALNNDGATKMTYAAPTAVGQARAIAEAHAVAEVDAATISYVETHGTGTPLGDPIEIEGLRQAFALSEEPRGGPCFVGSVKSNIGHLEAAAGIAGLIKTILCLKHRALPATLHFTAPNPELRLDQGPFVVRSEYGPWECSGVRRAGVSSFGVGGTNAHVVLEEAPTAPVAAEVPGRQVLLLSARSEEALREARSNLAAELSSSDDLRLTDVAHTLSRRRPEKIRMAAVVEDVEHAAAVLRGADHDNVIAGESASTGANSAAERVVFLFPGQGAQHAGMARGLYETEPVFADYFDQCAAGFATELGIDLRAEVFDGDGRGLERTDRTQPALFAVELALAKLAQTYGLHPAAVAGHSIGEYAAAVVAGVFDLPSAVKAVAVRARLMHAAARGTMVAIALSPAAVAEYLTGDVDLAAVNDPGSCVVGGTADAVRTLSARLADAGVVARRVRTSHAFHSRLMDPVIPEFGAFLSKLTLREPRIPLLSNVTGTWMSPGEATNPATWARQIRSTVRFSDELDVMLGEPDRVLVEVGPGGALTASAIRHPRWSEQHRVVRLMRHHAQNRHDADAFLLGLGQLWSAGVEVDWTPRLAKAQPQLVSLPGYPFARQPHWVEHRPGAGHPAAATTNGAAGAGAAAAAVPAPATKGGLADVEATLQRVWAQCLGIERVGRTADFFDLGGDSLLAIGVAMTAANEGLDLTPQDLYENPNVATLARTLVARYTAGGLGAGSAAQAANPPAPPNITHFLEHGLRDGARWRIPVVVQLRADVSAADVRSVLTAVVNHHDALRLQLVQHAGAWEQHIGEPVELIELTESALPPDISPGSAQERDGLLRVIEEQTRAQESPAPVTATYIAGVPGGRGFLALSLHGTVCDEASRDILLTDLFTAFTQHLAGEEIALGPVSTSWRDWSQRCAMLATHPAVVQSREYWLSAASEPTLRVADRPDLPPPATTDLVRMATTLTAAETGRIDDLRRRLRHPIEQLLLAALARTIAAAAGSGTVAVDLAGAGRSVLKPEVDLRRTVGWFGTVHPVVLNCAAESEPNARQLLDDVRTTLNDVPHYGIGYGLLRYLYGPTVGVLSATEIADVHFSYLGTIPDLPADAVGDAPVALDPDTTLAARSVPAGLGHALELRVYRSAGALHLDWSYDSRRLTAETAQQLAGGFSAALTELVDAALAQDDADSGGDELALVDLSATDS